MSDHDRIIMLESERDEMKLKVAELRKTNSFFISQFQLWGRLEDILGREVFKDILSVLEYGQGTHKPDEWKSQTVAYHLGHAYKHFEDYLRGETIDKDTGKSVLNNIIIRVCMASALEKGSET
jgi:hypothetical protein